MKKVSFIVSLLLLILFAINSPAQQGSASGKDGKTPPEAQDRDALRAATQIKDASQRLLALEKFINDFPQSSLKAVAKIHIFKAMIQSGKSEKDYLAMAEDAINTFPDIPQKALVLNDVAFTLAEIDKGLELALKFAEQALAKLPAEGKTELRAAIQDTLGWIHFKRGNYPEAIKVLEASLQISEEADTFQHLGEAYEKSGQSDKAIEALLNAVVLTDENDSVNKLALPKLKAAYAKKHGSEAGLDKLITEKAAARLKEVALNKNRYEQVAPAWELKNPQGEIVRLSDLRGKVVVLDWWGSWCPPCRQELPHIQKLYESYKDKGVVVIGMNWEQPGPSSQDRINTAKKFIAENKYTFPVVFDHDMQAGEKYQVDGFPTVFVIDRNGTIRYRTVGFMSNVAEILEVQIQTELARKEDRK
ncbi:MAG: redoxin domain-containing protein [Acidobacteriota bacterium]